MADLSNTPLIVRRSSDADKPTAVTGLSDGQIGLGIFQTLGQTVVALRAIDEGIAIGGSPGLPSGAVLSGAPSTTQKAAAQLSTVELVLAGGLLIAGIVVLVKVL